jgi:hypothetical protein
VAFAGLPPHQEQQQQPTTMAPPLLPTTTATPFSHGPHPSLLPGLLRSSGASAPPPATPSLSSAPSMSKLRRPHHHGSGGAKAAAAALFGGAPGSHHHHPESALFLFARWRRILARAPLGVRALAALATGVLLLALALLLSPPGRPTTTMTATTAGETNPNPNAHHHHRAATRLLESAGLAAAHAAHAAARAAARAARAGTRAAHAAHARAAFAGGGNTLADPFFYASAPVLVSYAYFEKDPRQRANFEYFLAAGTGDLPSPDAAAGGGALLAPAAWWRGGGGGGGGRRRAGGGSSSSSSSSSSSAPEIHFAIAVAGEACAPCAALDAILPPAEPPSEELAALGIASARSGGGGGAVDNPDARRFTLLRRATNEGMDLASHNATLSYLALRGRLHRYRFFFLINSSAMGPFVPSWAPPGWHWTHAFTARLGTADAERAAALAAAQGAAATTTPAAPTTAPPADTRQHPPRTVSPGRPLRAVRAVGSSLVCLPEQDAGGPGARLESWAVALDELGLASAVRAGALAVRSCKTCPDAETSIVVGGEYALTKALLDEGHNVATLLARYARGTDWSDPSHGRCNDNAHPSRAGSYAAGLSAHPFETVFVKSSWRVASPYTSRYSAWRLAHLLGRAGTEGAFDAALYRWGVSEEGTTGAGAAAVAAELERAYGLAAAKARAAFGGGGGSGAGAVVGKEEAEAARRAEVARQARRAIGIEEEDEEERGGA